MCSSDLLLGAEPIRAHRAGKNVSRQHESLLVEWARAARSWIAMATFSGAAQSALCTVLAGVLMIVHFRHTGRVGGSDLLLVFWALKLPSLGSQLSGFAQQYPAQRNALLRLLEPLSAPQETDGAAIPANAAAPAPSSGVTIELRDASVLAGGHQILRNVDLSIRAGEHVAIVGVSGAGKSSLLGVLLGWHRLSTGELRADGASLDGRGIADLRRMIAWLDPGIQIWNRSVLDNLEYASDDSALSRIDRKSTRLNSSH